MIGTILVEDLRVRCIVGVLPHERERAQDVLLDVELDHDFGACVESDDIGETVDYVSVTEQLTRLIRERQFRLIETMAVDACRQVLLSWPAVTRVRVTVRKPDAIHSARHAAARFEVQR